MYIQQLEECSISASQIDLGDNSRAGEKVPEEYKKQREQSVPGTELKRFCRFDIRVRIDRGYAYTTHAITSIFHTAPS